MDDATELSLARRRATHDDETIAADKPMSEIEMVRRLLAQEIDRTANAVSMLEDALDSILSQQEPGATARGRDRLACSTQHGSQLEELAMVAGEIADRVQRIRERVAL